MSASAGRGRRSDGGGLFLGELEKKLGVLVDFAACFRDHRDPRYTECTVQELLSQRVLALALGYEDLNDHDDLRKAPLLATVVGRRELTGADRTREADRGKPLAGKSTFSRLELTPEGAPTRYKKIEFGLAKNSRLLAELAPEMELAKQDNPCRRYCEFQYATGTLWVPRDSWTRERRVIGKAEYSEQGPNPCFVVTSLSLDRGTPRWLHEELYCARGDTIRLKLLKIGAQVCVTVRRVWVRLASSYPLTELFHTVLRNLRQIPVPLRC